MSLNRFNNIIGQINESKSNDQVNKIENSNTSSFKNEQVLIEKLKGNVALVTLNRPKALNALCYSLMKELTDGLDLLDKDDDVRAIVLTGSKRAFAAGADIKEMKDKSFAEAYRIDLLAFWQKVASVRTPIIGAINGYALGGGCELAMMCDILYAGKKAQFGQPEVLIGTVPGCGGSQRLTRIVGKSNAMEWILTGERFNATRAKEVGLVSKIFEIDDLVEESLKTAKKIAKLSRPIIKIAKESVNTAYETTLTQGIATEKRFFHSTFATKDQKEGMNAFANKRKPNYKHY